MTIASPQTVQLFIDELVLDGATDINEKTITAAIAQQTGLLINQRGLPGHSAFLKDEFKTINSFSAQAIGQQVANSFYKSSK